jgi:hypothetical protein
MGPRTDAVHDVVIGRLGLGTPLQAVVAASMVGHRRRLGRCRCRYRHRRCCCGGGWGARGWGRDRLARHHGHPRARLGRRQRRRRYWFVYVCVRGVCVCVCACGEQPTAESACSVSAHATPKGSARVGPRTFSSVGVIVDGARRGCRWGRGPCSREGRLGRRLRPCLWVHLPSLRTWVSVPVSRRARVVCVRGQPQRRRRWPWAGWEEAGSARRARPQAAAWGTCKTQSCPHSCCCRRKSAGRPVQPSVREPPVSKPGAVHASPACLRASTSAILSVYVHACVYMFVRRCARVPLTRSVYVLGDSSFAPPC